MLKFGASLGSVLYGLGCFVELTFNFFEWSMAVRFFFATLWIVFCLAYYAASRSNYEYCRSFDGTHEENL